MPSFCGFDKAEISASQWGFYNLYFGLAWDLTAYPGSQFGIVQYIFAHVVLGRTLLCAVCQGAGGLGHVLKLESKCLCLRAAAQKSSKEVFNFGNNR